MKISFVIIAFVLIVSCFNVKTGLQKDNIYYFYFQNNDETMLNFYSAKNKTKGYVYNIERADNIIFNSKKNELNIKKIKAKDTLGLNIKHYNWLNKFDNTTRYRFFNLKPFKKFFIIEKDTANSALYLVEVKFIEEID